MLLSIFCWYLTAVISNHVDFLVYTDKKICNLLVMVRCRFLKVWLISMDILQKKTCSVLDSVFTFGSDS